MATKRRIPESSKPETPETKSYFDVDGLLTMQHRSIETMVEANRIFIGTAQAVARCQSEMMTDLVEQMTRAFAQMTGRSEPGVAAPKEAAAAVQILFEKTAEHVRDIAEVLSKSNADAIQLVSGRMASLMEETRASAGQKAESREVVAAE